MLVEGGVDLLTTVAQFLFSVGSKFFNSILTDWGIIGLGVLSTFVIIRVVNFVRRLFK